MSFFVSQRTRELGLRVALGAESSRLVRLVIRQGATLAIAGGVVGVVGGIAAARFLASSLYGVSASDPLTFATVALLLASVALMACWIPARRATKVDPMVALRCE